MRNQKHNKYKNTGIIFELLVRQITSDTLTGNESPAIGILKEYFTNSELAKEYKIYKLLSSYGEINESKANLLIETAIESYKKLNKSTLRKEKYNIIKEIKTNYNIDDFFKAKIDKYKIYASISNILEFSTSNSFTNPSTIIDNKVVLLEFLTKKPSSDEIKDKLMETYLDSNKGMRFLAYQILIEKFNKKYSNLEISQKEILREYINNISNTLALKEYINNKFNVFKKTLESLSQNVEDKTILIKLKEVINIIKPIGKSEHVKDEDVVNLMQYDQLINEIKNINGR